MTDTTELSRSEHRGWTIKVYEDRWESAAWGTDEIRQHKRTYATVIEPGSTRERRPGTSAGGSQKLTVTQLTTKARKYIDTVLLDNEQRPAITRKMASRIGPHTHTLSRESRLDVLMRTTGAIGMRPPEVGDTAWVWGQGRWRSGMLTKITAKRAEVAYTTPSSNGRIYRPTRPHADIWMES